MEFAQLAILAAAAGAGDREAQADILFMLIDKDQNQTIEYHELARFCHNAERWGLLLDGDPQRTCEEVWSDASGYGNGMITQAQFRKVASRFRPVDLPAPLGARGAEWRELVEKHKEHYFRKEKDSRYYNTGYVRTGGRGYGGYGGYGGGGRGGGCFAAGTRVVLCDGTTKAIERVVVGDALAEGSVTVATLRFDAAAAAPLFEVRGVRVTADHAVLMGDRFVRARDAAGATRAPAAADGLVYDLITTDHRIRIVAADGAELECADYLELPEGRVAYDRLLGGLNAGLAVA